MPGQNVINLNFQTENYNMTCKKFSNARTKKKISLDQGWSTMKVSVSKRHLTTMLYYPQLVQIFYFSCIDASNYNYYKSWKKQNLYPNLTLSTPFCLERKTIFVVCTLKFVGIFDFSHVRNNCNSWGNSIYWSNIL